MIHVFACCEVAFVFVLSIPFVLSLFVDTNYYVRQVLINSY